MITITSHFQKKMSVFLTSNSMVLVLYEIVFKYSISTLPLDLQLYV